MRQVITISIDNKLLPRIDEKVKEKKISDRSTYFKELVLNDLSKRSIKKSEILLIIILLELALLNSILLFFL
jgi:metal-responsive CopG/Arc/MetJ family transcriptional regulator